MRSTSILAYNNAVESGLLSRCRLLVYRAICEYPLKTQNEYHDIISKIFERRLVNKPSITPVFAQLIRSNWIIEAGVRDCSLSGQLCIIYDITGRLGFKPTSKPSQMTRAQLEKENLELKKEIDLLKLKLSNKQLQFSLTD